MTDTPALSEYAGVALESLAAHPTRSTVSGISNGPYLVTSFGPEAVHEGLLELRDRKLAEDDHGRWHLTEAGVRLAQQVKSTA